MQFLTRAGLALSALIALGWAAPLARADQAEGGRVERFDVGNGTPPVIVLRVDPHVITTVDFSAPVIHAVTPPWPKLDFVRLSHSIELRPQVKPNIRYLGTFVVRTRSMDISVELLNARPGEQPTTRAIVTMHTPADQVLARALANIDIRAEQLDKKFTAMHTRVEELSGGLDYAVARVTELNRGLDTMSRLTRMSEDALIRLTGTGVDHVMLAPRSAAAGKVVATTMRLSRSGSQGVARVTLSNTGQSPATIGKISMQAPQVGSNHVSAVYIRGARKTPDQNDITTIQPGESANLTIILDNAESLIAAQAVGLSMSQEDKEASSSLPDEIWFYPEPTAPVPHENEGRRTLFVKGMLGGIQLTESIDGSMPGGLETAFLSGYGARLTYGLASILDLETELVYAKSGTASFGGIERSASLVRVQFGGLLRFGKTYMPTLRAGLGLHGASQRRVVNGMEESRRDFDLSLTGGVGMDIRLSEGWVVGGALSLDKQLSSDSRSLEFALHLGYGWLPKREPPASVTPFGG